MFRGITYGLLLTALGIFSMWLFYILGERDATGPIFIIMLGVGCVYATIAENRKHRSAKRKYNR